MSVRAVRRLTGSTRITAPHRSVRDRWLQHKEYRMAQQIRALMPPNPVAQPGTALVHEAARAMGMPRLAT
jgi:hypothetical protein